MGEEPPSAGDFAQLKAAIGFLVLNLELGKERSCLSRGDTERLGESACAHGVARNKQERLKGAFGRGVAQGF